MTTSIDMLAYMKLRGDLTFRTTPYNDVDAMILTQLSSIDYRDAMPGARTVDELEFRKWKERPLVPVVAERYKAMRQGRDIQQKEELLFLVGQSKRFAKVRMDGFIRDTDVEKEKQFSALTFFFSPFRAHVAFRGTDGSFVSWKENFNMSYQLPVPAQEDAVKYLEKLLARTLVRGMVGGHSKGGNLALYASVFCSPKLQRKIEKVFCFDAPGLSQDISGNPAYINIQEKICAYVPKSSVIGTIMKVPFEAKVVESDAVGIRQHRLFSWQVEAGGLVSCKERDGFSRNMQTTINEWLDAIPKEEKPDAVNELFDIFRANHIQTFDDMIHLDWRKTVGLFRGATKMSAKNRERLLGIIKRIWDESRKIK